MGDWKNNWVEICELREVKALGAEGKEKHGWLLKSGWEKVVQKRSRRGKIVDFRPF